MNDAIIGITLTGALLLVIGGFAVLIIDSLKARGWTLKPYPSQAVSEPMPTEYEQEWLDFGYARDALRTLEDYEVAALDEWYGLPVLPDTPNTLKGLSAL